MYFYTDKMPNGKKFEYTFLSDFDIADHFGTKAIQDTYKRAFNEWKTDIKAIAEMSVAGSGIRKTKHYANFIKIYSTNFRTMFIGTIPNTLKKNYIHIGNTPIKWIINIYKIHYQHFC